MPVIGLNYKDKPDDGQRWLDAERRSVSAVGRRRATAASASTGASTACPRPSSSTSSGIIRYKQIGPITVEALEQKILPLVRELQKVMMDAMRSPLRARAGARARRRAGVAQAPTPRSTRACKQARRRSCAASSARTSRSPIPSAPLAEDLRREVRALAVAGKSDDEIKHYLVARYGDFVLYDPPVKSHRRGCCGSVRSLLLAGGRLIWLAIVRRAQRRDERR